MTAQKTFPWSTMPRRKQVEGRTPLIYYGGKSRDADWIISQFPQHTTFVDVFGGGGAITFRKLPSQVDVYNDIGNVSNFFKVLREHPDELYHLLYMTPFSREEFELCRTQWPEAMERGDSLEWARMWYVTINQGYTHEEYSDSWHIAKQVNSASALANHTDELPDIVDRLRHIHIEHLDFRKLIPLYDNDFTLFYLDPPYVEGSRVSLGTYVHEMKRADHVEMLNLIRELKGQVVLSGYSSELYDLALKDWRRVTKTAKSAIQNSRQVGNRGDRTEVLWIKEHGHGQLWSQADVPWVSYQDPSGTKPVITGRRKTI